MNDAEGVEVIDGVDMGEYPTAVSDGSGTDPVYVGRIREDISHENGPIFMTNIFSYSANIYWVCS